MSFPSQNTYTKVDVGWGFAPDPIGELTALPYIPSRLNGVASPRKGEMGGEGSRLEGGVERKESGGKEGGRREKLGGAERHGCWVIDVPGGGAKAPPKYVKHFDFFLLL